MLGRGTRVLEVYREGKPKTIYALKIYWQVIKDPLEGERIADLRAEAAQHGLDANEHLLDLEDYGIMNIDSTNINSEDKTTDFLLSDRLLPVGFYWITNPSVSDAINVNDNLHYGAGQVPGQLTGDKSVDMLDIHKLKPPISSPIRHRKHVFTLSKDVGITLHEITSAHSYLHALRGALGCTSLVYQYISGLHDE